MALGHDGALRTCLVWLAIIMVIIWLHTESLKKVMVTYVVGVAGIAGILLPDWDFFDRDIHRWSSPLTSDERAALFALRHKSLFKKYRIYPVRVVAYTTVYGFALHRWWVFISS